MAAGDFPGSICIPGTEVGLKIAGLVRTTGVATLGPLGTEDRFVTSSIPVEGSQEFGKEITDAYPRVEKFQAVLRDSNL